MRESKIQGQAIAIFGGQIGMKIGYDEKTGYCALLLCELIDEHNPGDEIGKGWPNYGEQIQLVFKDLKSLNVVRTALDYVERTLKDGKIPEMKSEDCKRVISDSN